MKRAKLLWILLGIFALVYASAQEVVQEEFMNVPTTGIEFQNFQGVVINPNTVEEIRGIGRALANVAQMDDQIYRLGDKYAIRESGNDELDGLLSAAIIYVNEDALVENVRNLRLIISGYLEVRYGYSTTQADTLAYFLTFYNALHRGDVNFFASRYKPEVMVDIDESNAGLDIAYSQWPGRTRLFIPLSLDNDPFLNEIDRDVIDSATDADGVDADQERENLQNMREESLDGDQLTIDELNRQIQENEERLAELERQRQERENELNNNADNQPKEDEVFRGDLEVTIRNDQLDGNVVEDVYTDVGEVIIKHEPPKEFDGVEASDELSIIVVDNTTGEVIDEQKIDEFIVEEYQDDNGDTKTRITVIVRDQNNNNNSQDGNQQGNNNNTQDGSQQGNNNNTQDSSQQDNNNNTQDGNQSGNNNNTQDGNQQGNNNNTQDGSQQGNNNNTQDGSQQGNNNNTQDGNQQGNNNNSQDGNQSGNNNNTQDGNQQGNNNNTQDSSQQGNNNNTQDGNQQGNNNNSQDGNQQGNNSAVDQEKLDEIAALEAEIARLEEENQRLRNELAQREKDLEEKLKQIEDERNSLAGNNNNTQDGNQPGNNNNTQDGNQPGNNNNTQDGNQPGNDNNAQDGNQPGNDNNAQDGNQPGNDNNAQDGNQPGNNNNSQDDNQPGNNNNSQDDNQQGNNNNNTQDGSQQGNNNNSQDGNQPGNNNTQEGNQPGNNNNTQEGNQETPPVVTPQPSPEDTVRELENQINNDNRVNPNLGPSGTIYFMMDTGVRQGGRKRNVIVSFDLATQQISSRSPDNIASRSFALTNGGLITITERGEPSTPRFYLTMLDKNTLQPLSISDVPLHAESFIFVSGSEIYVMSEAVGDGSVLMRFNANLDEDVRSQAIVNPDTTLTMHQDYVFVEHRNGTSILVLNRKDLSLIAEIKL